MRLLIITQKVDPRDHVLGFFFGWVTALARKCSSVLVICLEKSEGFRLPQNVQVFSLGKETRASRVRYLVRFYRAIVGLLNRYDAVFIHMNPVYAVLGWWVWRLAGKRYSLWFNHPHGSLLARCAIAVSPMVFCTSPFAFAARYSQTNLMAAGIDTSFFVRHRDINRIDRTIVFLGRISPIKKIDVLIEAAGILDRDGEPFLLNIIGSPAAETDADYYNVLQAQAGNLCSKGKLRFMPKVSPDETVIIYNSHDVFVNLTPTGSLDKTVLEAMACEAMVVVANKSFFPALPDTCLFQENDAQDLARKLRALLHMPEEVKRNYGVDFRHYVVAHHSLDALTERLFSFLRMPQEASGIVR